MSSIADPRRAGEITQRLKKVTPENERQWGRMTAHQMICHLADAMRMTLNERPCAFIGTWASQHIVKLVALYSPFPWPKGVKGMRELDQEADGTRPVTFEADRDELLRLIERVRQVPRERTPPQHPMFGLLSWDQWKILAYRHCDHHLRQFGV
jgi:hypothetical protein